MGDQAAGTAKQRGGSVYRSGGCPHSDCDHTTILLHWTYCPKCKRDITKFGPAKAGGKGTGKSRDRGPSRGSSSRAAGYTHADPHELPADKELRLARETLAKSEQFLADEPELLAQLRAKVTDLERKRQENLSEPERIL